MESLVDQLRGAFESGGDPVLLAVALAFLWLAGAVVASFAGLVADRIGDVPEGRSVLAAVSRPPSHCPGCGRRLGLLDLVPVIGWFACRGRCRCGNPVPAAYPAAEFIAGTATAAMPFVMEDFGVRTGSGILILWTGILIAWIDLKEHVIPEELTWLLLFSGLLISPFEADPWSRAAGAAVCCGAMWLSLAAAGWMRGLDTRAGGDVALAAAAGAWLGLGGAVSFLLLASFIFVLHALPARFRGVEWVPMGPSLAAALLASAALGWSPLVP